MKVTEHTRKAADARRNCSNRTVGSSPFILSRINDYNLNGQSSTLAPQQCLQPSLLVVPLEVPYFTDTAQAVVDDGMALAE